MPTTPVPGPPPTEVDPAIMAARYGHRAAHPSRRAVIIAAVVAALLVVGAVVLQTTSSLTRTSVTYEDLGFTVQDPGRVSVRFNLITDPGTTVRCTLTALNQTFTEVGFKEVVIGPVSAARTAHEADVTTTEPAVTGSVKSCEVVDG